MPLEESQFYEFEDFRLDRSQKILLRHGDPVSLTPKVFDTLEILVQNSSRLLKKDELLKMLWPDRFVEESNLTSNIKMLRKALGDDAARPRFIETVQRRGYRFIADVRPINGFHVPDRNHIPISSPLIGQRRYILITVGVLVIISLIGIAFVRFGERDRPGNRQPRFARLTSTGKVTNVAVIPNGQAVVFSQKESNGEALWLRQIDSGVQTEIMPPQDAEFTSLTVSPDGKFVYYSVFSKNSAVSGLSRIPVTGGTPEVIGDMDPGGSVSFSPDGSKFAFTESFSSTKQTVLKVANADGTDQRVVVRTIGEGRVLPIFRTSSVAWSPDGERLACVIKESDENGTMHKIMLVDPETGGEESLLPGTSSEIEYIAWKDTEHLAFIQSDPGSTVKPILQVSRKTGQVRQLTNDLNGYRWLSSAGGQLFTLQETVYSSLHVVGFGDDGSTSPSKQIFGEWGLIESVGWSKEEKIYFNSSGGGRNEIWQIRADGIAPQPVTSGSNLVYTFAVSPIDGSFVFSSLKHGRISLSAADPDGQNIRLLTEGRNDLLPVFSPNGENVIFQSGVSPVALWSISPHGGQTAKQLTGYFASHPAVSPDGKQIAFHFMDYGTKERQWKLGLIDLETGKLLDKFEFPTPVTHRKMAWHPGAGFLTMVIDRGEDSSVGFWSLKDGKVITIDSDGAGRIGAFAWSHDGSRLTYSRVFLKSDLVSLNSY